MALRGVAMAAVIAPAMSTKKREVIFGGRIMGAKIRAEHARELAKTAQRDADRAEAELWSIRMEAYGGPAQPSPTITQCLSGGLLNYGQPSHKNMQAKSNSCMTNRTVFGFG